MKKFNEFINESKNDVIIDRQILRIGVWIDGAHYEGWISPSKGDVNCFLYDSKELTDLIKTQDGRTAIVKVKDIIGMNRWPW